MMLTRKVVAFGSLLTLMVACGDDGGGNTVDAPADKDIGFNKPTQSLKAFNEVDGNWVELGPADLSCLGTATADSPTTVAVDLTTTIRDFQKDPPNNLVPGASVTLFRGQDTADVLDTGMSDGTTAMVTVTIPTGVTRFGFKVSHDSSLDTLLLNQTVDPAMMMQTIDEVRTVSKSTAQTLPALIGVSRTAGTGVLAGAMRDCSDNEVSGFIATVSSTPGTVTHLPGADTYYFSEEAGLPVRHSQQAFSSPDGLFMIIEMAPTQTAYVQVWGYKTDADMMADNLTLISELPTAVIADTVITGSYEPLRQ